MRRLAILVMLVLAIAGGAGAAWWFLLRPPASPETAEAGVVEEDALLGERRIELEPLVLPIIREGQVTLHVTLVVVVELASPVRHDDIKRFAPPLRDALLSELHALFSLRYVQDRGYDLPVVRERLMLASERVLGAGMVTGVALRALDQRAPWTS